MDKQNLRLSVEDAIKMATDLHKNGEFVESEMLYRDILKAVPQHPDVHHFLGVLLHQTGDSDAAVESIRHSLELAPDHPDALNNLGNILRETGRLEDAESTYRQVLKFAPKHADTLVNLGTILRRLKQHDEAIATLKSALDVDPDHANAYHNLGNIYFDLERVDDALEAFQKCDELEPDNSKTTKEIARLLYLSGREDDAIEIMEKLLDKYPDDAVARHSLAAYSGRDVPERASDDFVRDTFNSFSMSFDEVLGRLDYKAPEIVADAVKKLRQDSDGKCTLLDIGCGTGLCGKLVRPVVTKLMGVDLAPGMLRKAQLLGVYDMLEEAELTEYMSSREDSFDIVTCVDTFVYFGELGDAIDAAAKALRPSGHFLFTVERHLDDECEAGFWLRHHGRYSHSSSYIEQLLSAAGFRIVSIEDADLRKERGKPVAGMLAVAEKL